MCLSLIDDLCLLLLLLFPYLDDNRLALTVDS